MTITVEQVKRSYAGLRRAKQHLYTATENETLTRGALERARLEGLTSGTITGKNDAEREACARALRPDLYEDAAICSTCARAARHHHELAALAVEELRALLRLDELAAYTQTGVTPPSHHGG